MALQEVVKGLYRITPVPGVNAYLFDSDGLTVIDTAIAGSAPKILRAVAEGGRQPKMERAEVEQEIHDGEQLPGDLRVVHAPGHSDGHIALLWSQHGGVLLAADSCWNLFARLSLMPFYVDVDEGRRSLARLS